MTTTDCSPTSKALTVNVADWTNSRKLVLKPDRVILEVARTDDKCHQCPTCLSRATKVEQFLNGGSYVWKWDYFDDGKWISVALPKGQDHIKFLADAVGLPINGVNPARTQPEGYSGSTKLSCGHSSARVRVNHWDNARSVIIEDHRVLLQITLTCNHCKTCSSRVGQIDRTLRANPDLLYRWEYVDGWESRRWISIPRQGSEDPLGLLRRTLGVSIEEA